MTTHDRIAAVLRERLPELFMAEPLTYIVGQETESEATNRYWNKKAADLASAIASIPGLTITEPPKCIHEGAWMFLDGRTVFRCKKCEEVLP